MMITSAEKKQTLLSKNGDDGGEDHTGAVLKAKITAKYSGTSVAISRF